MYDRPPEVEAPPTAQLSRQEWVSAAWAAFVDGGIGAVTVQAVARRLGVTRGSFYHHFEDRDDLLREILRHWQREYTIRIRDDVEVLKLDPAGSLLALARLIRSRGASLHDVRVRAWAISDPLVRDLLQQVDEQRLAYIRGHFAALGFDAGEAECRARLFLYYEMAEPAVLAEQSPETAETLLLARHALLTGSAPFASDGFQPDPGALRVRRDTSREVE